MVLCLASLQSLHCGMQMLSLRIPLSPPKEKYNVQYGAQCSVFSIFFPDRTEVEGVRWLRTR